MIMIHANLIILYYIQHLVAIKTEIGFIRKYIFNDSESEVKIAGWRQIELRPSDPSFFAWYSHYHWMSRVKQGSSAVILLSPSQRRYVE